VAYQATDRKTHLKEGEKKRLSLFIDHKAHRRLERIATHRKLSVTALIEQWAEKEEERIVAKMATSQAHSTSPRGTSYIVPLCQLGQSSGMKCRTSLRGANDNSRSPPPMQLHAWDVYRAGSMARACRSEQRRGGG
jgi:hypothetical protein